MIGLVHITFICLIGLFLFLLIVLFTKREGYSGNTDLYNDFHNSEVEPEKPQIKEYFSSDMMSIIQIVLILLVIAVYLAYINSGPVKKILEFFKNIVKFLGKMTSRLSRGMISAWGKWGMYHQPMKSTNPAREAGSIEKAIQQAQKAKLGTQSSKMSKTTDDISTKKPGQITSGIQRRGSVSGARSGTPLLLDIPAAKEWSKTITPKMPKTIAGSQDDYFGYRLKVPQDQRLLTGFDIPTSSLYKQYYKQDLPYTLEAGKVIPTAQIATPGMISSGIYSNPSTNFGNIGLLGM